MLLSLRVTLICLALTRMLAAAPPPDKPLLDSVTEHFAAARPGTVPRIPASLFLQVDTPARAPARDEETPTESATLSEEVKYFTAYPSLALSSPADSSLDSATLKDLPTTERIAVSLTQPPPPPVRLHQTAGMIKTSTTAPATASSDVEEDLTGNISDTPGQQVMQTFL